MFFYFKNHVILILILLMFILNNCKLQDPTKYHGIAFLENRANELNVKKDNKNDVIKILGQPHTKSFREEDNWIYLERVLTKGSFHKLGQNIVKTNNVLILDFDKYGILKAKQLLNKDDINKMKFSEKKTENNLSRKSFIQSFLSSVKSKMYGNR